MATFTRNKDREMTSISKRFGHNNQPEWLAGFSFSTEDYNEDPSKGITYAIDHLGNLHLMEFLDRTS